MLFDPLLDRVLGVAQLATAGPERGCDAELEPIVHGGSGAAIGPPGLKNTGADSGADARSRSRKRVCAAVIGSAAMLVQ